MLLLVGLGNPGEKYARHRHNVGFMAVDAIVDANGFGPARSKFQGEIRDGTLGREKAMILKPQTFMNDSGQAVGEASRFYKIAPEDIIVFYDELDLAPGKLRVKIGGGAAGHNGIRSIDSHIGNSFRRIRIGIGHPGDKSRVTNHVLGDFGKSDQDWLAPMLDAIATEASFLAESDGNRFATAVAQKLAPPQKEAKPDARPDASVKNQPSSTGESEAATAATKPEHGANAFTDALKKLFGDKK
jgi:PTH1 family peptidyl-tRNA hydrolase